MRRAVTLAIIAVLASGAAAAGQGPGTAVAGCSAGGYGGAGNYDDNYNYVGCSCVWHNCGYATCYSGSYCRQQGEYSCRCFTQSGPPGAFRSIAFVPLVTRRSSRTTREAVPVALSAAAFVGSISEDFAFGAACPQDTGASGPTRGPTAPRAADG